MRMGLVISCLLHASVIGLGIFTISGSQFDRHELDIVPVSVDLVPIADVMALREGDDEANREDSPAPKPTQKPQINQQAKHVGDGQVDSDAALKPKEKPRDVEATPPPAGVEQAKPQPVPLENKESVKPQEMQTALEAPTLPESIEAEPVEPALNASEIAPSPPEATPEVAVETTPAPPEAEPETAVETAVVVIPTLPQNVPQPQRKPKPKPTPPVEARDQQMASTSPPPQPQGERTVDDLLDKDAHLIDRTPTQGGGMRRSEQLAGSGAPRNVGDNQQLAQTIQNVIGGCIKEKANIGILIGSQSRDLVVRVHLRLNRDGSINGVPDLMPSGGDPSEREIATTQGYAALARCAPFRDLPPERYDDGWFDVTINWRPLEQF